MHLYPFRSMKQMAKLGTSSHGDSRYQSQRSCPFLCCLFIYSYNTKSGKKSGSVALVFQLLASYISNTQRLSRKRHLLGQQCKNRKEEVYCKSGCADYQFMFGCRGCPLTAISVIPSLSSTSNDCSSAATTEQGPCL